MTFLEKNVFFSILENCWRRTQIFMKLRFLFFFHKNLCTLPIILFSEKKVGDVHRFLWKIILWKNYFLTFKNCFLTLFLKLIYINYFLTFKNYFLTLFFKPNYINYFLTLFSKLKYENYFLTFKNYFFTLLLNINEFSFPYIIS